MFSIRICIILSPILFQTGVVSQLNITTDICATIGDAFKIRAVFADQSEFIQWKRTDRQSTILLSSPTDTNCAVIANTNYNLARYNFTCDPIQNVYTMEIIQVIDSDVGSSWTVICRTNINSYTSTSLPIKLCRPALPMPSLSPNGKIIVPINGSLTLTCNLTGLVNSSDMYTISWFRDKHDVAYGTVNDRCFPGGNLSNSEFNVTCPDLNQQLITINRVDLTFHNSTWVCACAVNGGNTTKSAESGTIIVNDCTISESLAGYEQEKTDMLFNVDVPREGIAKYEVAAIETNVIYWSIAYVDGAILGSNTSGGIEPIGDLAEGNLSIRISSMDSTYVGFYILQRIPLTPRKIKCIELSMRVRPQTPNISNKEILDDGSFTIRGTPDQPLTLTCTSTGGFPKPNLRWFRDNNYTHSLSSNGTYTINNNGNYIAVQTYTFTPTRQDDMGVYVCQSSYDYAQPSYQTDEIILYLNLKPLSPSITTYTIVEGILGKAAICTASQYRPNNAQVWLQIDGYNTTDVPDITIAHNVTTETFSVVAVFNLVLNRHSIDHNVSCHISHDSLHTPFIVTSTIQVYYAPDVEVITTNVTVFDTAILTCKPSGLPAAYTYSTWRHTWPGYGTVTETRTLGNNQTLRLTSLTYEYSGVYHCSASNGVTGSLNPNAGYGATFLQVGTFPIILTQSPIQAFTTLQTDISIIIHFYSNRQNNMVQCSRNSTKFSCASFLEDSDISLPVFDYIVRTNGFTAKIFVSIQENSDFGMLTVTISNDVGATTIDVYVLHSEGTQTTQAEQTTNVALVLGLIGLAVAVIICIIAAVVFVMWKRRSTENTQKNNTSIKSEEIKSPEHEVPIGDIGIESRQGVNNNVERGEIQSSQYEIIREDIGIESRQGVNNNVERADIQSSQYELLREDIEIKPRQGVNNNVGRAEIQSSVYEILGEDIEIGPVQVDKKNAERDEIQSSGYEIPREGMAMKPTQAENNTAEGHVYEDLTERIENTRNYECLMTEL